MYGYLPFTTPAAVALMLISLFTMPKSVSFATPLAEIRMFPVVRSR
jgi:hypothetical protein